jgi:hypothetical protein
MIHIPKSLLACSLSLSLISSPFAHALAPAVLPLPTNLDDAQARALLDAKAEGREVEWRLFTTTIEGQTRSVLLLGEIHIAYPEDIDAAKKVIDQFEYMATENGPFSQDPSWHYRMLPVAALMLLPENALVVALSHREATSPMLLAMKGARRKYVANAERLHVPSAGEEADVLALGALSLARVSGLGWLGINLMRSAVKRRLPRLRSTLYAAGLVIGGVVAEAVVFGHVAKTPLVRNRDVSMTKFIDQWVKSDPSGAPLLVIVGRGHLKNMSRFLVEQYGFNEVPIDESHLANVEALVAR